MCVIDDAANKTDEHTVRADYKGGHGHIPIDYFVGNFISRKGGLSSTITLFLRAVVQISSFRRPVGV